jgi:3-hydroxyisobutyrate dehydrogenase-like beta-hydroxyacid dehydrogenase
MPALSMPEILASAGLPATTATLIELPPGTPDWVRIVFVGVGVVGGPAALKLAAAIGPRILAGRRAKKEHLAAAKRRRAKQLREDADTANDSAAAALDDEADGLEAEAAELDAISKGNK